MSMLQIEHGRQLSSLTTFKIGGLAREYTRIAFADDVPTALAYAAQNGMRVLVLGGGSNMLVSDSGFDGLVVDIANKGISLVSKTGSEVVLSVQAGEVWDDVVEYSVANGWWGIENLSRIPGKAGSVAVQNVGAYGEEASEVIVSVDVYDRKEQRFNTLSNKECDFTYRKSIFNTTHKDRYIILSTLFRLHTEPKRNLGYPDVKRWFEGNPEPSQREIREAIAAIRDRKFPFPAESIEGNAGSFFKNSLLPLDEFEQLRKNFEANLPDHLERLLHYAASSSDSHIKIPSAFILEVCGLKGYHVGYVMLNPTQPVVVLNVTGNATAKNVLDLVTDVREVVRSKTGLYLWIEPELIGFSKDELERAGFNAVEIERFTA